jgi:hypothetical protein
VGSVFRGEGKRSSRARSFRRQNSRQLGCVRTDVRLKNFRGQKEGLLGFVKREFKKLRYFISTCIFWMGDECCKRTVHSLYYIYTSQASKPNPITAIYTCLGDHPACIAGTSGPSRVYLGTGRQSHGAIEARAPMPIRKKESWLSALSQSADLHCSPQTCRCVRIIIGTEHVGGHMPFKFPT